ncbi:deoxyribonuclease-1-like [Ptychodera flava]|uniref:deoxyribonuclease-1-like n=1 Tax=Ptychodera flava TaxID=63121 RepID=UPI003969D464
MRVVVAVVLLAISVYIAEASIKIAAWNVQVLGVTKMGKPDVVDVIVDTCMLYDIIAIQEIRDASLSTPGNLLNAINAKAGGAFRMEVSERLGRSSSKEQYAVYYRHSKFSVIDRFTYADSNDFLERPNFNVRFSSPSTNLKDFVFSVTHVKPSDAVAEIDHFVEVNSAIESRWGVSDILIGGDYNAGCNYVRSGDWGRIRYRTDSKYQWLIPDSADTTVTTTNCPYDRLTIAGAKFKAEYKSNSAKVFNYDSYFGLSNQLALDVSDHYPVEMVIN